MSEKFKNVAKLFWLYFCAPKTKHLSQVRNKPEIFVNFRPEPGPNPARNRARSKKPGPTYNSERHKYWYSTKLCCVMGTVCSWIEDRILRVWKITRGSTAHKQFWTLGLTCFSNLSEMLPIQDKLRWTGNFADPLWEVDKNELFS